MFTVAIIVFFMLAISAWGAWDMRKANLTPDTPYAFR